ncbi:hypothetical protein VIOR3934_06174 [Vibrio orientalis CIP 102891 = ATCC 33934]|uniref:RanBP2-type domain-containing protein n=1 Tax=Vibrio orientalis CIP 102891 = ATCC 33934 TaxID=675816 RepID=C9QJJ4_VIBOR|nr:DUF2007 domain-containing protein [Vibrio orientalis]EEX91839.1 hypothetical protein VIA_002481 [Vibrio orientalis CIP 102891 = ATCC 33934]EGU48147.1 hypothetical protein VIOR3934_06174 [Vibrio orientalis CIP 102891 = ATCC 33934]
MKVFSAVTPTEAHIICELLKSQSIDCEVRGEGIFGLQGEIPFGESSEPYIWLFDQRDSAKASEIIREFQSEQEKQDWQCDQCGEQNEGQFGACWQCGSVTP